MIHCQLSVRRHYCAPPAYALHACMRRRADMYSITIIIIFSYKFKIVNNKEKPSKTETKLMEETKTAQYVHDIELHFSKKEKRTQTR